MSYALDHVSKYHRWFVELGYPQLDIVEYDDGEWCIIEYLNRPIMPSLTRYQIVLSGLRNIIPTQGFVAKYIAQIDPQKKAFWERENAASKRAEDEYAAREKHAEATAEKAKQAIVKNEALMERIAKNGLQEMDLDNIAKHVPRSELV